jgi:DNA anti-recombination protein RmuC
MSTAEKQKSASTSADKGKDTVIDPTSVSEAEADELGGGGSVDKIREILFGIQMRDYEKRFVRLEERLLKESIDLREETKQRFDALELYIKHELEALAERLVAEQNTRADSLEQLSKGVKDTFRAVDKKTAQMDEQSAKSQRELREQMLDQSKTLSDDMRQKYSELLVALEREATELRTDKTDRSALAALFTEVAMRLNNDFKIPGAE